MTAPTVLDDLPEQGGLSWNAQFAVAVVAVVVVGALNVFAEKMNGTIYRSTAEMRRTSPELFPDLGWRVTQWLVPNRSNASLYVGMVGPLVSILALVIVLLATRQPFWVLTTFFNAYVVLMSIRVIAALVTYWPAVWSRQEALPLMGTDRFAIMPSGHTIGIVLPLVFLALVMTDQGSEDRALALLAAMMISLLPVSLVFATRIHHTSSVVIAVALSVLAAFVATDHFLGWEIAALSLAFVLTVLMWNLLSFGWPQHPKGE